MKYIGTLLTMCAALLLFAPAVSAEEVAADKEWTVTFNTDMYESSFNEQTVFVLNEDNERIDTVELALVESDVLKVVNTEAYAPGSYRLIITESVHAVSGKHLVDQVEKAFEIPAEQVDEPEETPDETGSSEQMITDIFELTNKERKAEGLEPFVRDAELEALANKKAKDFYENDYFAHNSPVYGSPFDMVREANPAYRSVGENIAAGYQSAEAVVEGWMNSPGHRANILSDQERIGIGHYRSNENGMAYDYYVQLFGTK
ncbi:CAP domain-containing protein [Halobacillus litoralis]|uniref:CAP domain-containing protein n=1 Tax=Halobacillus litoralis TaxID=45668 RepID=UPI001CD8185B|nr:CAP domain-containing protein [Halobacillus litoralis]MCA0970786.1 CAP domain-containing protein [Halobacillus litoralis]